MQGDLKMTLTFKSEELWNETIMLSQFESNTTEFIDCAGIAWPSNSFPIIPVRNPNSSRNYPKDGDGFRAGKIEWDALAISVLIAKNQNKSNLNEVLAIELGASAAPWALTFLKHVIASTDANVNTIAIEAGDVRKITEHFWKQNNIRFSKMSGIGKFVFKGERFNSTFLRGIATNAKGKMYFPRVDISKDNGATGARVLSQLDWRGKSRFHRVRAIDTLRLIEEQPSVSLLHMDVQGSEVEIIQDSRFGAALKNVQVMLIGTHSALADELAESINGKYGFTLIAGNRMKPGGSNGEWPVDGEFLFVNTQTLELLTQLGFLAD
jgi:hypothetical protein